MRYFFLELTLIPHHKGKWVTDGIFLTKHDTKKETISFRTLKIGKFNLNIQFANL